MKKDAMREGYERAMIVTNLMIFGGTGSLIGVAAAYIALLAATEIPFPLMVLFGFVCVICTFVAAIGAAAQIHYAGEYKKQLKTLKVPKEEK